MNTFKLLACMLSKVWPPYMIESYSYRVYQKPLRPFHAYLHVCSGQCKPCPPWSGGRHQVDTWQKRGRPELDTYSPRASSQFAR
jgi:hypothetical protein